MGTKPSLKMEEETSSILRKLSSMKISILSTRRREGRVWTAAELCVWTIWHGTPEKHVRPGGETGSYDETFFRPKAKKATLCIIARSYFHLTFNLLIILQSGNACY